MEPVSPALVGGFLSLSRQGSRQGSLNFVSLPNWVGIYWCRVIRFAIRVRDYFVSSSIPGTSHVPPIHKDKFAPIHKVLLEQTSISCLSWHCLTSLPSLLQEEGLTPCPQGSLPANFPTEPGRGGPSPSAKLYQIELLEGWPGRWWSSDENVFRI